MYWVQDFLLAQRQNPEWVQPTLLYYARVAWGAAGIVLCGIVASIAMGINLGIWARFNPRKAVIYSLALTTLVAPYLWSWDFVFLLPLFCLCWIEHPRIGERVVLPRLRGMINDEVYWWVPVALWGIICLVNVLNLWGGKSVALAVTLDFDAKS